jgi:hypothetical protein
MDIVSGVVPISCATPPGHWQHANLLIVANRFCRDASSACKLPNRQRSFHSRSSLCDMSGKKGTCSSSWKVKGFDRPKRLFFPRVSPTQLVEPSHAVETPNIREVTAYNRVRAKAVHWRQGAETGYRASRSWFSGRGAQGCPAPPRPAPISGCDRDGWCKDWPRRSLSARHNGAPVLA